MNVRPPGLVDEALLRLVEVMRRYHRHQVRGLAHLKKALASGSPVLLVGNHCFDVVDPILLRAAVYDETARWLRFVGHEMLFFRLPLAGMLMRRLGVVPSRDSSGARHVLQRHGLLMLYPGAGGEAAMRSYRREPYQLKWHGRFGFVELALREHATVLFVSGIGIDEMYYQTDVPVFRRFFDWFARGPLEYLREYRGARLQLGVAGLHVVPGLLPFPVRLTHVVSEPLSIDTETDPDDRRAVEELQVRLWAECQEHLDRAVERRERDSDLVDRVCRGSMRLMQALGV